MKEESTRTVTGLWPGCPLGTDVHMRRARGVFSDGEPRRNVRSVHRRNACSVQMLTCARLRGCCSDVEPRRRAPTLLPGHGWDARFVSTTVLRRAGRMLQHYGRQGILKCVRTGRTSITRRVHYGGRYQDVGRISTVSMRSKKGCPRRKNL